MIIYLVIPCYNEEEALPETALQLNNKMNALISSGKIDEISRILLVDDGSKDKTWELIEKLSAENKLFSGIKLSRNRGHQNALLAGLMYAKDRSDAAISMDADLQDDINAVDKMIDEFSDGVDIVYGVRSSREKDSFFKRATAQGFYKFMNALGVDSVYNHADYRLMSRRALEGLAEFKEVNLFLRGIVPLIGYRFSYVYYERGERLAGESKYPLKKMLALAMEGITSFSVKPIRLITMLGFLILLVCLLAFIYIFISFFCGNAVSGWTSLMFSIWGLGGIQLLAVGVIGEYVGKVYFEVKNRPKYIIEQATEDNQNKE